MEKTKKVKKKKWIKGRHRVVFFLLRGIFYPILKIRYKLKYKKEEKKLPSPCIVMCNHQATFDPFFISITLRRPVYFIISEDLFTLGFISKLIVWLIAPISKSKSKSDINTIRQTLKVLGEGGTVALFPSGNRTLSGREWEIDVSTAKLVKMAKVPLVLYNICGGYGTEPRWGKGVRKGRLEVGVKTIITPEQIKEMSVEELHAKIVEALDVDDSKLNARFKSKRSAEHLERALYYCPECSSFNTLTSKGKILSCSNCGFKTEYGEDLKFKAISGELPFSTVREWYDAQAVKLLEYAKTTDEELFSDKVIARTIKNYKRDKESRANISATKKSVFVKTDDGKNYELSLNDIYGATVLGKRKINFYLDGDVVLQIEGDQTFSAIKYLYLYQFNKEGSL